jgi:hypothetical protein
VATAVRYTRTRTGAYRRISGYGELSCQRRGSQLHL